MAKVPKPTDYVSLRKIWYKKLKKSGFEDIEVSDLRFNDGTAQFRRERSMKSWEAKQAYYTMAEHFLNEFKFETRRQRIIWEYHTNGISIRDIATTLRKAGVTKMGRGPILQVIKHLRSIMMERYMVNKGAYE